MYDRESSLLARIYFFLGQFCLYFVCWTRQIKINLLLLVRLELINEFFSFSSLLICLNVVLLYIRDKIWRKYNKIRIFLYTKGVHHPKMENQGKSNIFAAFWRYIICFILLKLPFTMRNIWHRSSLLLVMI